MIGVTLERTRPSTLAAADAEPSAPTSSVALATPSAGCRQPRPRMLVGPLSSDRSAAALGLGRRSVLPAPWNIGKPVWSLEKRGLGGSADNPRYVK